MYRSLLERQIALQLSKRKIAIVYETLKLKYRIPENEHTYTPDFLLPNGIIIEAKGRLSKADRDKALCVRECHPKLDIRFVFQRASNPIYTGSSTTYADWCRKHGFQFSDKGVIPDEWFDTI